MSRVLAPKRKKPTSSCGPADDACVLTAPVRAGSLDELVADYIKRVRPKRNAERARYTRLPSLDEANRVAALSIDDRGKRLSHQRRIPADVLDRVATRLRKDGLRGHDTFCDLYERIVDLCGDIERFGALTRYDVATRIAAHLDVEPERVYLHSGTRVGAKELGVPHRGATVELSELPRVLRRLRPAEIEDFLCIYKDQLGRFKGAW